MQVDLWLVRQYSRTCGYTKTTQQTRLCVFWMFQASALSGFWARLPEDNRALCLGQSDSAVI